MPTSRCGFSLMEVLLSTSILVGCTIVLVELATIGRKQANAAYDLNIAQLLCEAKLNEIVAGISDVKAEEEQELQDNPGWLYSVEVKPQRHHHLIAVKVSVFQESQQARRSQRFTLVRWLPDATEQTATRQPVEPTQTTNLPRREGRP